MASPEQEAAALEAIRAHLARSRAEIRGLLEPPVDDRGGQESMSGSARGFPRSRTMQALMSGRGLGTIGAIASGLVLARPALAWRLIRLLPTSAVARALFGRILHSANRTSKSRASREAPDQGGA